VAPPLQVLLVELSRNVIEHFIVVGFQVAPGRSLQLVCVSRKPPKTCVMAWRPEVGVESLLRREMSVAPPAPGPASGGEQRHERRELRVVVAGRRGALAQRRGARQRPPPLDPPTAAHLASGRCRQYMDRCCREGEASARTLEPTPRSA